MKNRRLRGYSEDLEANVKGVIYYVNGCGNIRIRRGGLGGWHKALREATEEVLGMDCNHNYVSHEDEQTIRSLACNNFLVVELIDLVDAETNEVIPNTLGNKAAIFCNPENISLVDEVIFASTQVDLFLIETLNKEAYEIKKP